MTKKTDHISANLLPWRFCSIAQTRFAFRGRCEYDHRQDQIRQGYQDHAFTAGPHLGLQLDTEFEGPPPLLPFIAFNQRGYASDRSMTASTR